LATGDQRLDRLGIGQIGLHHFFTRLCRGHGTNVAQAQHLAIGLESGAHGLAESASGARHEQGVVGWVGHLEDIR
jgi:hypothetical protein